MQIPRGLFLPADWLNVPDPVFIKARRVQLTATALSDKEKWLEIVPCKNNEPHRNEPIKAAANGFLWRQVCRVTPSGRARHPACSWLVSEMRFGDLDPGDHST